MGERYAYFVRRPGRIGELTAPHLFDSEKKYEIVSVITLRKIDYENFAADMLADRAFLEQHAPLCSRGSVWKCLLIRRRGKHGGILVQPENGCYVGWAALAE